MRNEWPCILALVLTACHPEAGSQQERLIPARPVTAIVSDTVIGTFQGAWVVAQSPLEDVNLKRQAIPEQLQNIEDNPYIMPKKMLCNDIRKEIAELDALLGPDVCTPENPTGAVASRKGEYVEKGAGAAKNQVVGMVSSKTNIIPFRGAVRFVSGADRHAKEVERAYQAGKLRRAFLKGLASALGPKCLNPIADSQPTVMK